MRPGQPPDRIALCMSSSRLQVTSRGPKPASHDLQRLLKLAIQLFRCVGLYEEAATPRYPQRASRIFKTAAGHSPSRTTGSASSVAIRSVQDISRLHWRYFA
jgi:hypothetical protein